MKITRLLIVWLCIIASANGNRGRKFKHHKDKDCKPNIVLVIADDLGWNDVGWKNREIHTPNLDRLARHGVILENSYVQPACSPSRSAIYTGKYPYRLGMQYSVVLVNEPKAVPVNETLLPQLMKKGGYKTHLVGKWHIGHCSADMIPTARGFDSFYGMMLAGQDYYTRRHQGIYDFWENDEIIFPPSGSYDTDLYTDRAVKIIKNHNKKKPFFLTLAHAAPHFPLLVPQRYKDLYPHIKDDKRKSYLGMVSSIDDSVGKVMKALKRTGQMDNTVIVFISDNGGDVNFGASNFPLRGNKGNLWEGGVKSVGFVYGPKYLPSSGHKYNGMMHAVDWYDTILDIAGYNKEIPKNLDSRSQWPYIRRCHGSARNELIYSIDEITNTAAIRVGKYKLIKGDPRVVLGTYPNVTDVDPTNDEVRLYNLKVDPHEQNNLARKKPKTVRKLKKRLSFYRHFSVPAQVPPSLPMDVVAPNGILRYGWC